MNHSPEHFIKTAQAIGISLSDKQVKQFMDYYELLIEWNSFMNLTAITEFDEVMIKHFIDSMAICQYVDFSGNISLLDVGTGAGFPGIPLKILYPDCKIVLLDSLNKRLNFLNTVIEKLELSNISTLHGGAEDYAKTAEHREQYDYVVSRAVANLSTLSELCVPYVKEGGYFLSYKSEKAEEEIQNASKAFDLLGAVLEKKIDYSLPEGDLFRSLLLIKKSKPTPKKYPRKAGTPAKEPL